MTFWTVLCLNGLLYALTYSFNSASKKCCEVWALHFPFLHNAHDTVPPEACIYDCIKCCLAQAVLGVPGPSQMVSSCLMYRSNQCWYQVVPSWHRSLIWIYGLKVIKLVGIQLGVHLPFPLTLRRWGAMGTVYLMCDSQYIHYHHPHLLCRLVPKSVRSMEKPYFK